MSHTRLTAAQSAGRFAIRVYATFVLLAIAGCGTSEPDIVGKWSVYQGETDGEPLPADHRYIGQDFTITKDQVFIDQGEDGIQVPLKLVAIDWQREPHEIRLLDESNNKMATWLIKADGDTLTFCISGGRDPQTPASFDTAGTKNLTLQLRK
ncbi:MAG: TIGR03067 domain-containing protein [Planctomycetaceae bacterium]